MAYLSGIQEALYQMKDLVIKNSDIRKLVMNDGKSPLDGDDYSLADIESRVFNSAVFDVTEPPYNKNTIITLALTKMEPDNETKKAINWVRINIITRAELWELSDYKIRPVEISNLIIRELEDRKLKTSHRLFLVDMELIVLDDNINGYGLTFVLVEGSGLDEKF